MIAIGEQVQLDGLMFNILFIAQCKSHTTKENTANVGIVLLLALDGVAALAEGGGSLPALFLCFTLLLLSLGQHLSVLGSGLLDHVIKLLIWILIKSFLLRLNKNKVC